MIAIRLVITFALGLSIGACTGPEGPFSEPELNAIRQRLGPLPEHPPDDPTNRYADDDAAARLGQQFFFDARYSENGEVSCATCHDPTQGFQDNRANTSMGLGLTGRHAPSVINAAYGHAEGDATNWQMWDGRKDSQWAQALGPAENAVEMGSTRTRIAYLIYDRYRAPYEELFGAMAELRDADGAALFPEDAHPGTPSWDALSADDRDAITDIYVTFGKAVAAYERKIVSRNSRFDAFHAELAAGATDSDALSTEEKRGLRLFLGKGGCLQCHGGPNFSDWAFHNIGISQVGQALPSRDEGRSAGIASLRADEFNCASRWSDHPDKASCGLRSVQDEDALLGAFKTPSLRDVTKTAPYMHTGTITTLEAVVDHYDEGGDGSGFVGELDDHIGELGLSDDEKKALVAFLETLEGEALDPDLTQAPELP